MNDVELEDVLIKHFRLLRHSDGARESEIPVERFAKLPPQAVHLNAFAPALFDWKLDLARARVCVLMGCAAAGIILGVFYPALDIRMGPHATAISYAMPAADFPADGFD